MQGRATAAGDAACPLAPPTTHARHVVSLTDRKRLSSIDCYPWCWCSSSFIHLQIHASQLGSLATLNSVVIQIMRLQFSIKCILIRGAAIAESDPVRILLHTDSLYNLTSNLFIFRSSTGQWLRRIFHPHLDHQYLVQSILCDHQYSNIIHARIFLQ